jgi:hypothetical protein
MIVMSKVGKGSRVSGKDFGHDTLAVGEDETGKETKERENEPDPQDYGHSRTGVSKVVFDFV